MAFRGGRGGRGFRGGGGGFRAVRQVPFELFPEIPELSVAKCVADNAEELVLARWAAKFQRFWNSSPYYDDGVGEAGKKKESKDIKRYCDKDSERTKRKAPLSDFIKMTDEYVPAELGEKERRRAKKVCWEEDPDQQKSDLQKSDLQKFDLQKLDLFEQQEKRIEKGEKEKKDGEEEEEDDENIDEEEEEEMSDDDYNQNIDFDDDEDDFNMPDDNDDEATF